MSHIIRNKIGYIFRCGWCGHPCNSEGKPLNDQEFTDAIKFIDKNGDKKTELVHGLCCAFQEQEEVRYITKNMAMDAGDLSLEGQRY